MADDLSRGTHALLREFLDVEDADKICVVALCYSVEGLTYMKDVKGLYDNRRVSLRPDIVCKGHGGRIVVLDTK